MAFQINEHSCRPLGAALRWTFALDAAPGLTLDQEASLVSFVLDGFAADYTEKILTLDFIIGQIGHRLDPEIDFSKPLPSLSVYRPSEKQTAISSVKHLFDGFRFEVQQIESNPDIIKYYKNVTQAYHAGTMMLICIETYFSRYPGVSGERPFLREFYEGELLDGLLLVKQARQIYDRWLGNFPCPGWLKYGNLEKELIWDWIETQITKKPLKFIYNSAGLRSSLDVAKLAIEISDLTLRPGGNPNEKLYNGDDWRFNLLQILNASGAGHKSQTGYAPAPPHSGKGDSIEDNLIHPEGNTPIKYRRSSNRVIAILEKRLNKSFKRSP